MGELYSTDFNMLLIGLKHKQLEINYKGINIPFIYRSYEEGAKYSKIVLFNKSEINKYELYEYFNDYDTVSPASIVDIDFSKSKYDLSGRRNNIQLLNHQPISYEYNNGLRYVNNNEKNIAKVNIGNYRLKDNYLLKMYLTSYLPDVGVFDNQYNTLNITPSSYLNNILTSYVTNSVYNSYNIKVDNQLNYNVGINNDDYVISASQVLNGYPHNIYTYIDYQKNLIYYNQQQVSFSSINSLLDNQDGYLYINGIQSGSQVINSNANIKFTKLEIMVNPDIIIDSPLGTYEYDISKDSYFNFSHQVLYNINELNLTSNVLIRMGNLNILSSYNQKVEITYKQTLYNSMKLMVTQNQVNDNSIKIANQEFIPEGNATPITGDNT